MASIYKVGKTYYVSYYERRGGGLVRVRKKVSEDYQIAKKVLDEVRRTVDLAAWGIRYKDSSFLAFIDKYLEFSKVNKSLKSYQLDCFSIGLFKALFRYRSINEVSPLDLEQFKEVLYH